MKFYKSKIKPNKILLEPFGKNTAPAIALAALLAVQIEKDPILLVLSSDHQIKNNDKFIEVIKKGVLDFSGVGRRYEKHVINFNEEKKFLIDDYGHHPLEIRCNLDAIREEFQDKKILMIFQPHRYTRTAQLYDEFVDVLNRVDSLILLDIYSASEEPIKGITSSALAETIKKQGHKNVLHVKNHDDLLDIIKEKKDLFDVIVTQGAGSISKVCESIIRRWKI